MTEEQKKMLVKLGARIKTARESRGLTLREMGYKIEKEAQSISRLEQGKVNPSYLFLLEICKGLDIDLSEIVSK